MNVQKFSMPNYKSPIGKIIKDYLNGKFEADDKTFELLQTADKQHAQLLFDKYEEDGTDILIIDRYIHSLLCYGAYMTDRDWLKDLSKFIKRPDVVVYLDVEPEVSMHRRGKFGDNDLYESDVERLRFTKDEYARVLKDEENDDMLVINIDANVPKLIVKSQLIRVSYDLYSVFTGKTIEQTVSDLDFTDMDLLLLDSWYRPKYLPVTS